MFTALTIAGSDSGGGAGIQADIKTMQANGVFATSAITALTAQNTLAVTGIMNSTAEFLGQQLDAVFSDIFPDAVKIGMVSSTDLIKMIGKKLREYRPKYIVVDPVMVATNGAKLIDDDAIACLKSELFHLATLLTPNIPEAQILSGLQIESADAMVAAAEKIGSAYNCAVLCKGGHNLCDADDYYYGADNKNSQWLRGKRIDNPNTHGTGCTLSSAIAANLAKGFTLLESVKRAKEYISAALADGLNLGHGAGPLNHGFNIAGYFAATKADMKSEDN